MARFTVTRMTTDTTQTAQAQPYPTIDVSEAGQNDVQFYSVTTILKALHNPALEYYAIKRCAQDALDRQATWNAMLAEEGAPETISWLCKARYRSPKLELASEKLGSVVHKACEFYALAGEKPDREWVADMVRAFGAPTIEMDSELNLIGRMLNQFDAWLQRFQPEYTAAEMPVFNEQFGYAGSLDAIFTLNDRDGSRVRLITDYKTRREPLTARGEAQEPYPETSLQLAAYRHADLGLVARARRYENPQKRRYYLLSPEERAGASVKMPQVDGGLCLIITPQSCEAYPMDCNQEVYDFFLYTLEAFRWIEEVSKRVVGNVLVPAQ